MNPLGALREARAEVDRLKAEGFDTGPDEFVQEVILPLLGTIPTEPDPEDPPILTFGPDVWTLVNGTFGTVDDRGRTALAVGEGDGNPATWTTFTAPLSITPGSDWTIRLLSTGEINEDYSATIVEETGSAGMDMRVTQSFGTFEGTIRSGTSPVVAPNSMAFSPTKTEYIVSYTAGVTTISIYGAVGASGAGVAASGAGTITVIIPPLVALFSLRIYDYAWSF